MEGFQIYNFGAMSRQGLENILSCPFSYFWALSKLKNNIKQLKNN